MSERERQRDREREKEKEKLGGKDMRQQDEVEKKRVTKTHGPLISGLVNQCLQSHSCRH